MSCNKNTPNVNKTFIVEPSPKEGFIEHTISNDYKKIDSNDMYFIWDDFTIESGSTVDNDGRLVIVNGSFNNFGSYSGTGTLELITTNLEYILNYGNQTNGNLIYYTNSPSGWSSGDTISDISAATGNVLVTKEWVNNITNANDDFTTGSTLIGNVAYFDRTDSLSAYTLDLTDIRFSGGSGNCISDLFVTNIYGCSPITVNDELITLSGITLSGAPLNDNTLTQIIARDSSTGKLKYRDVASIISAATSQDTFVTGGTLVNKTLVLDRNDSLSAVTVDLSGLTTNADNGLTLTTGGTIELGGTIKNNRTIFLNENPLNFKLIRWGDADGSSSRFNAMGRVDTLTNAGRMYLDAVMPTQSALFEYKSRSFSNRLYAKKAGNVDMDFNPSSTFSGITHTQSETASSYLRKIYLTDDDGTGYTQYNQTTSLHQLDAADANNYTGRLTVTPGLTQIFSQDASGLAGYFFSPSLLFLTNKDSAGILASGNNVQLQSDSNNYIWLNDLTTNDNILRDATANKRGFRYTNFGEIDVSGTSANYSTLVGTSLVPKKYVDDEISSIVDNNDFTTGSTLIGDTVYFDRTDSLSAYTLDLSSLDVNDTFITGMTFNPGNYQITATRNDGVSTSPIDLSILSADVTITGGTYDIDSGVVTFTNNSGGTFDVSGFTSGMTDTYTTSANLSGSSITFNNNINGSNFYNVDLIPLLSGKTDVSLFDTYTANTATELANKVEDGANVGGATEIFSGKSGTTLVFKTISGGTNTTVNNVGNINVIDVTIPTNRYSETGITSTSVVDSINTGTTEAATWHYSVNDGTNLRAGTIVSGWLGANVVYTETSTTDIGDTSAVTFDVNESGGDIRLVATASSGTWTVKVNRLLI